VLPRLEPFFTLQSKAKTLKWKILRGDREGVLKQLGPVLHLPVLLGIEEMGEESRLWVGGQCSSLEKGRASLMERVEVRSELEVLPLSKQLCK